MANSNKVYTVMSKEVIRLFETNSVCAHTMNTQYDKQYQDSGSGAGGTINIVQPQRYTTTTGATISIQDNIERSVSLARTTQEHVALSFTSKEITQDLTDPAKMAMFSKNKLETAIQALCATIDSDVLNRARKATYNTIGTPGTNPSAYSDITSARAVLQKYNAPRNDRHYILTPDSMGSINQGTSGLFNPTAEKSDDYRSGQLKDTNGFTFWDTDFLARHTNGDADDATALIKGTIAEGATSVTTDGWGATETITEGTTITFAGVYRKNLVSKDDKADLQKFVVTADATAVATEMTISISPAIEATGAYANVSNVPADNAAITVEGAISTSYDQNLFYQKEAFVFATCDLADINAVVEQNFRDEDLGITMKFTSQGDISNFKAISRLDVLYGFAAVAPWWAGKQWGQ